MRYLSPSGHHLFAVLLTLLIMWTFATSTVAEDECSQLWTIAGKGTEEPWLRTNGYQIGMDKSPAYQIRRVGLRNSIAQDKWTFMLPSSRIVLVFKDGKLVSGTLILEGRDYDKALPAVIKAMGLPEDFGADYALWRSEECDTVKILKKDGSNVTIVIQSFEYFAKKSVKKRGR